MTKRLYIETVGCQMNLLDSELVVASLRNRGYALAEKPSRADVILFNTCSVREHAEEKIYSALGRLKHIKRQHPEKVIGVIGCMAQNHQSKVFQRAPYVDLVVGPGQLHQIPDLIDTVTESGKPQIEVSLDRKSSHRKTVEQSFESYDPLRMPEMRPSRYQAFVRIQIGCDKFCTYCIVPKVRGPEQGRNPKEILVEAQQLADEGCREIILLGQTVNSYQYKESGKTTRLSDLLYQLSAIEGIDRLKFVTNYPRDMKQDLLQAVSQLPKCAHYLHVPAQSGSNRMLRLMKRGYTVEQYREMLAHIRDEIPSAAVTSDFIVGFCGETEDDFALTCELVQEAKFKNSFIFKYSERPGTKGADRYPDDIPDKVKKDRNNQLLSIQNAISEQINQQKIGCEYEVLVEGPSKSSRKQEQNGDRIQLTGRTMTDDIVVFDGNLRQMGQLLPITIYDANAFTLFGEVRTEHVGPEVYSLSTGLAH